MKKLVLVHRWLGVIACVSVLMFAGSGILHPVMSRFQPKSAQFVAPAAVFAVTPQSLQQVLASHGIDQFTAATVVQLATDAAYRVQLAHGEARYFDATSGAEIADGELRHARALAQYFAGNNSGSIVRADKIEKFDDEYVFVNRLLPVWRVQFDRDDGLTAYVDTAGNRLATLNDNPKRIFQNYFRMLHDFDFVKSNTLRVTLMLILLTATFTTAVAGVLMYLRLKNAGRRLAQLPARRWHRRLALAIAVSTFSFSLSGTLHLVQSQRETIIPAPTAALFNRAELGNIAIDKAFTLVRVGGVPCFRIAQVPRAGVMGDMHEHHHPVASVKVPALPTVTCIDTHSGETIANADERLAEQLARHYANNAAPLRSVESIMRFSGEYGFINKRLPVWQVQFSDDDTRWYVETLSGALALRADSVDAFEGNVFSLLHKARFIGDEYKNLRDALLMLFAFGNIVVALLGLWVFGRQIFAARNSRARGFSVD